MTTDPALLFALASFAFFSALGDTMKLLKWRTLRKVGSVFKLAAPLTAGYVATMAARKAAHWGTFPSWSDIKPILPVIGLLLLLTHVFFRLDANGYLNLDAGDGGASEPPTGKPVDGATG